MAAFGKGFVTVFQLALRCRLACARVKWNMLSEGAETITWEWKRECLSLVCMKAVETNS